ncbi:MAG: hypothetical protein ACLFSA_02745 [Spirochaetaceae bacterium]
MHKEFRLKWVNVYINQVTIGLTELLILEEAFGKIDEVWNR